MLTFFLLQHNNAITLKTLINLEEQPTVALNTEVSYDKLAHNGAHSTRLVPTM